LAGFRFPSRCENWNEAEILLTPLRFPRGNTWQVVFPSPLIGDFPQISSRQPGLIKDTWCPLPYTVKRGNFLGAESCLHSLGSLRPARRGAAGKLLQHSPPCPQRTIALSGHPLNSDLYFEPKKSRFELFRVKSPTFTS